MPEVDYFIPGKDNQDQVPAACNQFKDIDNILKKIQDPDISLQDACVLFDGVIDKFSATCNMKNCLGTSAEIVEKMWFESAFAKLQDGIKQKLSYAEEWILSIF